MKNVEGSTNIDGDNITLTLPSTVIATFKSAENRASWGTPTMILGQFLRKMDGSGTAMETLGNELENIGISGTHLVNEVAEECARVLKNGVQFELAISWEHVESSRLNRQDVEKLLGENGPGIDMLGSIEGAKGGFKGIGPKSADAFAEGGIYTPAQIVGECLVWTGKKGRSADSFAEAVQTTMNSAGAKQYASTVNAAIGELL